MQLIAVLGLAVMVLVVTMTIRMNWHNPKPIELRQRICETPKIAGIIAEAENELSLRWEKEKRGEM